MTRLGADLRLAGGLGLTARYAAVMAHAYAVEVELPVEAFRHQPWAPAEVALELRLLWLVDQVRQRRLGYAKAAELAGLPQARFVRVLGEHHVSAIDLDEEEVAREIAGALAFGQP